VRTEWDLPVKRFNGRHNRAMHGLLDDIQQAASNVVSGTVQAVTNPFPTITGLSQVTGQLLLNTVQNVGAVITTIGDAVVHATGQVITPNVINNLGVVTRAYFDVLAKVSPERNMYNFLSHDPLVGHAFRELDKFSGGMITDATNVSDLVARAGRGDAISKQELVKDAIFGLKVAAIVTGGGAVAGGMIGNMVGNQVCKNQTDGQDACRMAFTVIGAAGGADLADLVSDTPLDYTFSDYLSDAASNTFSTKAQSAISQTAVNLCKQNQWAGATECTILGTIASDYLKAPEGTDWLSFLASEAGKIGALVMMANAFPPGSPERIAIQNQLAKTPAGKSPLPRPKSTPPSIPVSTAQAQAPAGGAGKLLLIGGAALIALLGANK
jgi:hypothetical protein